MQGANCEFDVDECEPEPCLNGGQCLDLINDFRCVCPHGTTGERCETNDNDCAAADDLCHHGGTCVDGVGTYSCQCPPGACLPYDVIGRYAYISTVILLCICAIYM